MMKQLPILLAFFIGMIFGGMSVEVISNSSPPVGNETITVNTDVEFQLKHTQSWIDSCRYDIYAETSEDTNRVGYIKDHCAYEKGATYLLTIKEDSPDEYARTRHSYRYHREDGASTQIYAAVEHPPGGS